MHASTTSEMQLQHVMQQPTPGNFLYLHRSVCRPLCDHSQDQRMIEQMPKMMRNLMRSLFLFFHSQSKHIEYVYLALLYDGMSRADNGKLGKIHLLQIKILSLLL